MSKDDDRPQPGSTGPRLTSHLLGHGEAEAALLAAWQDERLHHGWLLTGPKGIGKATLAFRFARFLFAHPSPAAAEGGLFGPAPEPTSLAVPPDHPVFRRVASGGHADLCVVERSWNEKSKRWREEIVIADVRDAVDFFTQSAAEGGWRVCIVDGAEDMNGNAQNALLKVLEEPPARCVVLLVSHAPGRLLPTIRSRCRRLALQPLPEAEVATVLALVEPEMDDDERAALAGRAMGSPGMALARAAAGAADVEAALGELVGRNGRVDWTAAHEFAGRAGRAGTETFETLAEVMDTWLTGRCRTAALAGDRQAASRLDTARSRVQQAFGQGLGLNLDKRQILLTALAAIDRAA
jgi:DNA polymerase-3 subunit delta'